MSRKDARPRARKKTAEAGKAAAERPSRRGQMALQAAFDLASVGVVHIARDGRLRFASSVVAEITGYGPDELLALRLQDITHPEDRAEAEELVRQVFDGEVQTLSWEQRASRKDGYPVSVSVTLSSVPGSGKVAVAVIEDITGRKRMEDALRLFRTMVQSLPLGITITGLDGKIIFVNPAEARMHGYAVDELLGREAAKLFPAPSAKGALSLRDLLARDRASDAPFTRETENVRRDGSQFPVTISSVPVRDMRGTPLGLVSVAEDITERKRMLDALRESEQKYRTLFESASDAIFIADASSGIITDCNVSACVLLGMTREEILGMHQEGLHPPEDAAEYRRRFGIIAEQRSEGMFFDNVVVRKDGERLWVDISSSFFESGGRRFIMGIFRDVTERKKADTAIRIAKQDWEATFDTITDMITIHDENFTIVRSNRAAAEILGLSWLEMGRAKCYEYFHGSACPPDSCPSCECLRTSQPSVQERYEPHLNKHLEIRAIPRKDAAGRIIGLIHVVRDISDRRKAEAEKAALEARLSEAQRMETIGNLAGGVAHEVRNPLNAIMALTDALDREIGANPEYRTFMQHMRTQVDRLSTLMNDLLELGKPVDQARLRAESLTEICALSVDAWKQSKWGHGREVVTSFSREGQGAYVLADAKKLQQVFINLLDNAAQHSPEGEPVRIEVPPPAGEWAEVRIADRGSGIPGDILPRVFDTFFTTRRGGTGLGLSIVKHIVEKHGGAITLANNASPPGCTANVVLPVLKEIP